MDGGSYGFMFSHSRIGYRLITGDRRARFGGARYPVLDSKMWTYENMDKSVSGGGMQIEYEDEDPRIHDLFERELEKRGLKSRMGEFVPRLANR